MKAKNIVPLIIINLIICGISFSSDAECEGCCGCSVEVEYVGEFIATAYCGCEDCNGQWTGQPTASGTDYQEGRTIAVDPSVIPLGSRIAVEFPDGSIGEFIAEDTGSGIKGNTLDVYIEEHYRASAFGVRNVKVYIEKEVE